MRYRSSFVVYLTGLCLLAQNVPPKANDASEIQHSLDEIKADSLRTDLMYIASDQLQGRDTPSPGLDLAADYIAAQFRRAGLEPGVSDSYFQEAPMLVEEPNFSNFELKLTDGNRQFTADPKTTVLNVPSAIDLKDEPLFKLDLSNESMVQHLTANQVDDKVVILEIDSRLRSRLRPVNRVLHSAKPALVILVDPKGMTMHGRRPRQLVDSTESGTEKSNPRVSISGEMAARFFAALKPDNNATATVHVAAPHRTPVTLRNVIGVLRGSDPTLQDTYVLLTAHYDHLGVRADGSGDRIYNGANDDGSGTVSVMEVARALAKLPQHPRRSIVFMTFFGEEEGLIGSEYYAHHPVWPIDKTIADLNLEQVGRTDSSEGPERSNASLTGFDYSDLTGFVQRAGERTGIKIYKNPKGSDDYFNASDNFSLAEVGVPAETLCVAFDYPDYHAVGDEWQKIDYDNMAKVDRAIALAMFLMADSEQPVVWNEGNPKTAPFVKAWKK
ncbi:MAG TPA: M28 family peptidase [Bryobacteraceae bacterium]|nr:M28 family peptidase [Bryobacteraceae bacterium]